MDLTSYLLGKKAGGGGGGGTQGVYTVKSEEEMKNIQNPTAGDVCIVQDRTMIPWVLNETNSNAFCFPNEVNISDIKAELFSKSGGQINFEGTTVEESVTIAIQLDLSEKNFSFMFYDSDFDDSLSIYYEEVGNTGKYELTDFTYVFNDNDVTIHDYSDGIVTRKAYKIVPVYPETPIELLNDLLGRFVKTKNYNKWDRNTKDYCAYFPLEIKAEQPFGINGDFLLGGSVDVIFYSEEGLDGIMFTTDMGQIEYKWFESDKAYKTIGSSVTINNAMLNPYSKFEITLGSFITDEEISMVLNAGLVQKPNKSFPIMYLYSNNKWVKMSEDGSKTEC